MIDVRMFPCLSDNYGYLVHDPGSGATAAVDTPDAEVIGRHLRKQGWRLTHILNTHHHADHVGGNRALQCSSDCETWGPAGEADSIPGLDRPLREGAVVSLGEWRVEILETPGHTLGHICYYLPEAGVAFVGDTLFSLGCGRLFEGTAVQMWDSLGKLMRLPDDTRVYCAHEYTEANARFALSVDPDNPELQARARHVRALRIRVAPTLPTTIGMEKQTNPFLRAAVIYPELEGHRAFARLREMKDRFIPR